MLFDKTYKIAWDVDSNDSGWFIDVVEREQSLDIEYFTNSEKWFFPVSFRMRDVTLGWDESSTAREIIVSIFSSCNNAEAVFGNRLARPVFWLWRQWWRLVGYLWKR